MPKHDSEEKATHRPPVPLPKSKDGVLEDMDEDEEEAVATVRGDSFEDDADADKDTGDLLVAQKRELSKLSVR